jgi:L-rhamnose-H+ transport protein
VGYAYLFGAVWGVGSVTFGLTMRYLGIALGMAVALGFCAIFGTLIPPIFRGEFGEIVASTSGQVVLAGVMVCMLGIGICGYAGICKERELSDEEKKEGVEEFALSKGFLVAVIAGVMSAGFAYGLQAGAPIADVALETGTDPLFQNNATLCLITLGGFTVNLLWCLGLAFKNRSLGDYVRGPARGQIINYVLCAVAGVTWYCQFFFYGMGTTKMGRHDFSSWTLHMAFIIIFSNLWGIALREWKGSSRKTMGFVALGLAVLIASTVVIGQGNRMGE